MSGQIIDATLVSAPKQRNNECEKEAIKAGKSAAEIWPEIATPVFGYKSHISSDCRFGFIRSAIVTSAAAPDGRQLRKLIDKENTSGKIWADSAYRFQSNEKWLKQNMMNSQIHRRKPKGKPMPKRTA